MTTSLAQAILTVSGSIDASIVVKATLVMGLPLLGLRFAARDARASVRHAILAAAFSALLCLPLAAALMPRVVVGIAVAPQHDAANTPLPTLQASRPVGIVVAASHPHSIADRFQWPAASTLFRAAWLMGTLLFLAALTVPLWRLRTVRRRGLPWLAGETLLREIAAHAGVHRPVTVLLHEDAMVPVTYGIWKPVVLVPMDAQEWSDAELRHAIVHELAHVRRGDWAITLLGRIVCAMYWFHPLAWMGLRALCLESERACDDAALCGADRTAYAEQLLRLAERLSNGVAHPVLSMANRSDLSARIAAVLKRDQRRGQLGAVSGRVIPITAIVLTLALAPLAAGARVTHANVPRDVQLAARDVPAVSRAPLAAPAPVATTATASAMPMPPAIQISRAHAELTPIVQVPATPQTTPSAPSAQSVPVDSGQAPDSYAIRANDTLSITGVDDRGLPQISKFRVDEAGTITVPFIGRISAAGKTISQLQADLAKRLAAGNFTVGTDVDQPKSGIVYVTGAVRTPTTVQIDGTLTVIAALVRAGSPTPNAGDEVQISHEASQDVVHVRAKDLNLGAGNLQLQDGDIVFVPFKKTFTITGQVRNPGSYVWTSGLTLEQAIALTGGLTARASPRGIVARRFVDGKATDVSVAMQDDVLPDDIIRIGQRIF